MKTTKLLALVLALAMVFALVSGCGSSEKETAAESSTPAAESKTPAAESKEAEAAPAAEESDAMTLPLCDEVTNISWWHPMQPFTMPYDIGVDEMVNFTYFEEVTNVHVDLQLASFLSCTEMFNVMIASREYPDVICGFCSYYKNGVDDAIDQDIIIDLMPYINNGKLGALKDAMDQDKDFWMYSLSNNGALGSANYLMPGGEFSTAGLLCRSDLLEKYDMDAPVTYDDAYAYLKRAHDEDGINGVIVSSTGIDTEYSFIGGYGVCGYTSANSATHPFCLKDGKEVVYGPITDEYREYIEMMAKWYSEGLIDPDFASRAQDDEMAVMASGNGALWSSSYETATTVYETSGETVELMGIPQLRKNADDDVNMSKAISKLMFGAAVSTQCEELDLVLDYINFHYTEEGSMIAAYGKEGETYTMENGEPVFTDMVLDNDTYSLIASVTIYTTYGVPAVVDGKRYSAGWNERDREVALGFTDDTRTWDNYLPLTYIAMDADSNTEYSNIMADIMTYVLEYIAQCIIGEKTCDDASWNEYVQWVEDHDIERATELMSDAYKAYEAKALYIPN